MLTQILIDFLVLLTTHMSKYVSWQIRLTLMCSYDKDQQFEVLQISLTLINSP